MRAIRTALMTAALATVAAPALAQTADADWILKALARPAPMRTDFVEVRVSPLLKDPLRLVGEYRRPVADTLVREVRSPYAETTTLRAGEATIARAGKTPRKFSLSRAPELASLQSSFGALLAGDRAGLETHYRLTVSGPRERWTLTLALALDVERARIAGGDPLRCAAVSRRAEDG